MLSIKTLDHNFDPFLWNNLATHPLQSWEWGVIRESEGKNIVRIGEYEGNRLAKVYLMTIHPIPHTPYSIGYIPKSTWPSGELLTFLKDYARSHKLIFIKLEPNIVRDLGLRTADGGLLLSPHPLFTVWDQVLDVTQTESELLAHMHHKTRYNIRLAEKKGVKIEEMSNDTGYDVFETLYFETCARQKYRGHSPGYHHNIWKHLSQSVSVDGRRTKDGGQEARLTSHILTASYKDTYLTAYQLWQFKDTLYYVYGGSSDKYRQVMAPNLLMWETIKLAKRLGCKSLGMWGSLAPNYNEKDPWAGFTRFKQGYGTKFVEYAGSFDLVANPLAYNIYNIAHAIRQKLIL